MPTRSVIAALLLTLLVSCSREDSVSPGVAGQSTADPSPDPSSTAPAAVTDDARPCARAKTELGDDRRNEYPALVAAAMDGAADPSSIRISRFMAMDAWSVVFADTPVTDPGWFVFESIDGQKQFKDVWAGMADDDDRPGLVQWAADLEAPADFAACFAETVID